MGKFFKTEIFSSEIPSADSVHQFNLLGFRDIAFGLPSNLGLYFFSCPSWLESKLAAESGSLPSDVAPLVLSMTQSCLKSMPFTLMIYITKVQVKGLTPLF